MRPNNEPRHYDHPSGTTCLDLVKHTSFLRGNCIKYLWRAGEKGPQLDDLRKADDYFMLLVDNPDDWCFIERSTEFRDLVMKFVDAETDRRRGELVCHLALRHVRELNNLGIHEQLLDWIAETSKSEGKLT